MTVASRIVLVPGSNIGAAPQGKFYLYIRSDGVVMKVNDTGNEFIVGRDGSQIPSLQELSNVDATNAQEGQQLIKQGDIFTFIPPTPGPKGDTGEQGIQGEKGDTGIQGQQGIQGIQGIQGERGFIGERGPKGDKGDIGSQGIQGIQGVQGIKGDKGDIGSQGIQGIQGIQGVMGEGFNIELSGDLNETIINNIVTTSNATQFDKYVYLVATDNRIDKTVPIDSTSLTGHLISYDGTTQFDFGRMVGIQGEKGDTGAQGIQGTQGIQGEQGIRGEIGLQGIQGEQGLKGDKGDTGAQGIKGDTGSQGIQGIKGDTGAQGLKGDTGSQGIQGIQGIKGDKGDKGDIGSQGIKGDTGSQGVKGDTGAQGSKGDTGSQGIQGTQGIKGDKGDKGDTGSQGIQGIKGDTGEQGPIGLSGAGGFGGMFYASNLTSQSHIYQATLSIIQDNVIRNTNNLFIHSTVNNPERIVINFTGQLEISFKISLINNDADSDVAGRAYAEISKSTGTDIIQILSSATTSYSRNRTCGNLMSLVTPSSQIQVVPGDILKIKTQMSKDTSMGDLFNMVTVYGESCVTLKGYVN